MYLSLFTSYALKTLILVGSNDPNLVTILQVSNVYRIPKNHLTKVAHKLGRAGYLNNFQGRNGGMSLARSANEIRIGEIVRFCEGERPFIECFDTEANQCIITPVCRLRHVVADAYSDFFASLDSRTLADIVIHPRDSQTLLEVR